MWPIWLNLGFHAFPRKPVNSLILGRVCHPSSAYTGGDFSKHTSYGQVGWRYAWQLADVETIAASLHRAVEAVLPVAARLFIFSTSGRSTASLSRSFNVWRRSLRGIYGCQLTPYLLLFRFWYTGQLLPTSKEVSSKLAFRMAEYCYGIAIPNAFSVGVSILPLLLIPESTWKAINDPRVLLPRTPSIGPE